jgi:hypothetical protein
VTIFSLLDGGFRLIRERGGALLIWTIIQLVATVGVSFATAAILSGTMDDMLAGASEQSAQLSYLVRSCLVGLAGLAVSTILYAAAQRVVIHPMEGGPGWLKLGMDEVRLFLLTLLYLIGFLVMFILVGLVLGIFLAGAGPELPQLVLIVLGIVACGYFSTKLSLTFPLTLKRRAFSIGAGWNLTKGHSWTLFATFFIIFLMLLAAGILIILVTEPDFVSAIFQHGFTSAEADEASVRQYRQLMLGTIDAPIVIGWVLTAIQGAIGYALLGGAAATAVQQLTGAEEGLSETFS